MISLDGFRADYLNRGITPNLVQFGKNVRYRNLSRRSDEPFENSLPERKFSPKDFLKQI